MDGAEAACPYPAVGAENGPEKKTELIHAKTKTMTFHYPGKDLYNRSGRGGGGGPTPAPPPHKKKMGILDPRGGRGRVGDKPGQNGPREKGGEQEGAETRRTSGP